MRAFDYASPTTKEQAVALLGAKWGETEVLAGGMDLLSLMKDYITEPKRIVNIKEIKELEGVKFASGTGLRIGALVTLDELMNNAAVKKEYPALVQAAEGVTSPQIRNLGTVGGDLCQRPRCWYYRNGMGLLAQDSSGKSLVTEGENKYHAILGNFGPGIFCQSFEPGSGSYRVRRQNSSVRRQRSAGRSGGPVLCDAEEQRSARVPLAIQRDRNRNPRSTGSRQPKRDLRSAPA